MANNLLYVFDETASSTKATLYCNEKGIDKIFLCPITASEKTISSIIKDFATISKGEIKTLPYLEHFHNLAFSERNNFIEFIHDFGNTPRFRGKNFRKYFEYGKQYASSWWTSLIAEKNPFKTDSYHNLIKFLTIEKLIIQNECDHIVFDIRCAELSHAIEANKKNGKYVYRDLKDHRKNYDLGCFLKNFIKGIKSYLYLLYKFFITKINMKRKISKERIVQNAKYMAITYFPLIDKDALKEKKFINKYFGPMQAALEDKYGDKFIWLALTLDMDGFDFKKSIQLGKKINEWGHQFIFIEEWMTLKNLLSVMIRYLYMTVKFLIKIPYLKKNFNYPGNRKKLWQIFKNDWFSSFSGEVLINGLMHYALFESISRKLNKDAIVTYLAENQAWEKAMNASFHRNQHVKTVGMIHTTAPFLYMPYFDFKYASNKQPDSSLAMPAPDYIACNGNNAFKLFSDSDSGNIQSFLWFATRYQYLKKKSEESTPWADRQNNILVSITATMPNQAREMLLYINEAFSGHKGYNVIIKEHYAYPLKSLLKRLNLKLDENIFSISNEETSKLLCSAKAMVVYDSSISLDSIAFGCPVIIPRLSSVVNTNPLSGVSDIPIYVNSPKELKLAVENIISLKESPIASDKCKDTIKDYFKLANDTDDLVAEFEKNIS